MQKKITNALQLLLITIGLLTPYAYLIGLFFYQAYMNSYGVAIDNFPLSIADTYTYAYLAVGSAFNDAVIWLFDLLGNKWVYISPLLLILFFYLLIKVERNKSRPFISWLQLQLDNTINYCHYKNSDISKSIYAVGKPIYFLAVIIYVFLIIFLLWWGIVIIATNQGKAISKSRITEFKKQGCIFDLSTHWNNCISIVDNSGNVIHQGLFVAQNNDHIAIFKKDGSYLIKLKDDQIVRKEFN